MKDDLVDKYLDEAIGFVQKLPYQEKKGKKKKLSQADIDILKSRGGTGKLSTSREFKIPDRPPKRKKPARAKKSGVKTALDGAVKVGDIFYNSWGYDQTNVDWYQVVDITKTGKSVKIRPIAGKVKETGFMSGETTPVKNKFTGPAVTKRLGMHSGKPYLPSKYGWTSLWDGKPKYSSWYA